jgi:hypothetical protein
MSRICVLNFSRAFGAMRRVAPTCCAILDNRPSALSRKPGREPAAYRIGCRHGSLCYRRHRFPPEIIQHAIWLYLRFTLSYRDVEELLAERGLDISYETVRRRPAILGRRREPSSR